MTLTQIPITKYMQKTESKPMVRHIRKFTYLDRELLTKQINSIVENGGSFYLQFRVGEHMAIPPPFFSTSIIVKRDSNKSFRISHLSTYHFGKIISLSKLNTLATGTVRYPGHLYFVTARGYYWRLTTFDRMSWPIDTHTRSCALT